MSHVGKNLGSGHYVVHIRKLEGGRWVIFDDQKVAVSEQPPLDLGYPLSLPPPGWDGDGTRQEGREVQWVCGVGGSAVEVGGGVRERAGGKKRKRKEAVVGEMID